MTQVSEEDIGPDGEIAEAFRTAVRDTDGVHPGRGRRGKRLFDHGELRLLLLSMIEQQPSHGYELIKAIEERMGGSYSPSPGVVYPTLSWLDDMGYVSIAAEDSGRKKYHIVAEGQAFLAANRAGVEALWQRTGRSGVQGRAGVPPSLIRAMENLKLALRLRLRSGQVDRDTADRMAAAIDEAARQVERC